MEMSGKSHPRVLIVAEHASVQFGGEAALPFHFFRVLRARGIPVWMICHSRTRNELEAYFGNNAPITFVQDSTLHKLLYRIGKYLPDRIAYITTGFISRTTCQMSQRKLALNLIKTENISVVHQPIPVSPKEPSIMSNMGAPVIIGPMNGGMSYPDGFGGRSSKLELLSVKIGRKASSLLGIVFSGKRDADVLLVANDRTAKALPKTIKPKVITLIENGVDLELWNKRVLPSIRNEPVLQAPTKAVVSFAAMGRMIPLKALDVLIDAFKILNDRTNGVAVNLTLIGDGEQRDSLMHQCTHLGIKIVDATTKPGVYFAGWRSQSECAEILENSDVLVMASLHECGGAVVLEAMALAKPVICTAWGGPLDYCDDSTAILIKPVSRSQLVNDFANAMETLTNKPELRRQLGEGGHARVIKEFDWERKVDKILEIYAVARSEYVDKFVQK
jgi:glycosyltransferase involved in cell wall biosynthesis